MLLLYFSRTYNPLCGIAVLYVVTVPEKKNYDVTYTVTQSAFISVYRLYLKQRCACYRYTAEKKNTVLVKPCVSTRNEQNVILHSVRIKRTHYGIYVHYDFALPYLSQTYYKRERVAS